MGDNGDAGWAAGIPASLDEKEVQELMASREALADAALGMAYAYRAMAHARKVGRRRLTGS